MVFWSASEPTWDYIQQSDVFFLNAAPLEASKVRDIQWWFLAVLCMCKDFSRSSESVDRIMDCRWGHLLIVCNFLFRNILKLFDFLLIEFSQSGALALPQTHHLSRFGKSTEILCPRTNTALLLHVVTYCMCLNKGQSDVSRAKLPDKCLLKDTKGWK